MLDRSELLRACVASFAVVVIAVIAHWTLRRLSRRLPQWIARQFGWPLTPGAQQPWQGVLELLLLLPKTAVWFGAVVLVSDRFGALRMARTMLGSVITMSITMPLVTLGNGREYTPVEVLTLPIVLIALWIAVGVFTRTLKQQVLGAFGLERGAQDVIALLTRYALGILGAVLVLQIWGIDASSLTFVASVFGVGIGFGLQHIANNFVSGLLVSLERPIQPGDFIQVGEWTGTVEKIGPRNTEIRTIDNVSVLVPNSTFLETEVVNWSHGDPLSRIRIPVGVAYRSDVARVRAALLEAAHEHPLVLRDPRPSVEFEAFGDSALQFELKVWTRDPRSQARLRSDLNYRIEVNLRRHGVSVPFPQRDLHLRSPQLEQFLAAWSRQQFGDLPAPVASETSTLPDLRGNGSHGADSHGLGEELGPRAWSTDKLRTVIDHMRGADGIAVADRRHLLTVYRRCFVGREAVDWMTHALGLTRVEAVELGQLLVERGDVRHVLDEHGFKDANLFYRFRSDESATPGDATLSASIHATSVSRNGAGAVSSRSQS